jgi:hypothetical protein
VHFAEFWPPIGLLIVLTMYNSRQHTLRLVSPDSQKIQCILEKEIVEGGMHESNAI